MSSTRSPLRYHGGKSQLAKKQVIYEPSQYKIFGDCCVGGGSYLCVKDRPGVSEYANDLDGELTNFFRVLQDDGLFSSLLKRLENTPFSQSEFAAATEDHSIFPDVDRAWAFFVKNRQSRQSFGKTFSTPTKRLRRGRNENVSAWNSSIDSLEPFRNRLRWVEIRQMKVIDFIPMIDSPSTFIYIDPTYLDFTRVAGLYTMEMSEQDHVDLLELLGSIEGKFMLCGYDSELYSAYANKNGWTRQEFSVTKSASSAKTKPKATEIIWMNYVL